VPVLHLLVGPNGAGKTTFHDRLLGPATALPFVNADQIARSMWPGDEESHGHDAARLAEEKRNGFLARRRSFIAETVFSHPAKLDLIAQAKAAGYIVILHVILVPEDLTVQRTILRSRQGGHSVPMDKVRSRFRRLWGNVQKAIGMADEAIVYDNTRAARPFVVIARYVDGAALYEPSWPKWSPLR
jgi:predicted ABC-type ATPase